ncbi:aldehyde dehydrogenase [candidate division KSB1 bacterium]|nr:MAG: aldehyde dehydrogenase [candidate division KSB1 bacterium]
MRTPLPFLVNGRWYDSKESIGIVNPYTREEIAAISLATPEDIERAIESAQNAFPQARVLPSHRRAEILTNIAEGIRQQRREFAEIITQEAGKPIRFSLGEVDRAIQTFTLAAEEAKRLTGEVLPLDLQPGSENRWGLVRRFPVGVILGITPFNFPLNLVAHKIAPALASGNCIILKPAPQTPLTALKLGQIIEKSGYIPGSVNIVPCSNRLAEKMVTDPRVKVVSFTGSAKVGWYLKQLASDKKVMLELGGNAGMIVEQDVNWEYAAERAVLGGFAYAGQVCIAVQRIYVIRSLFPAFCEKLVKQVEMMKTGNPMDPEVIMGPMISIEAAHQAEEWIQEAIQQGANLLCGGKRQKNYLQPTILTNTRPNMKVWSEEIFAPVMIVESFTEFEEALEMLDNSQYGLQAGVFVNEIKKIWQAFEKLEVGGVIINDYPTYRVDHMPYGGVKRSGFGREGIKYAIEEITEPKLLVINPLI